MRSILFFIFFIVTSSVFSQSFLDDFEDGDIAGWGGDIANYQVTGGELQLNGDCVSGGENYISFPATTKDSAVWQIYVRCEFDPSTSNYAKFYLQSDNADLTGDVNGYYIQVGGESGSVDAIKLYRQEGVTKTLVLTGVEGGAAAAPEVGIKIIRTDAGEWKLFVDYTGGTSYVFETSAFDVIINGGNYMGIDCIYTSTRCTLFYFDNVFIDPLYTDVDAPTISSVEVISSSALNIHFNEPVEIISAENESNYIVDAGVGMPLNATRDALDTKKVTLTFASSFPEAVTLTLSISGVKDISGNAVSLAEASFSYYTVKPFDIIIEEVMADPDPGIGLPTVEYLELYNTTSLQLDITNYYISDASSLCDNFPAFILESNDYVIITDDANVGLFDSYGNVIYISNFPSLNNDGDHLQLFDADNNLLHDINYTTDWYQSAIKSEGGYSLEMIDINYPCQEGNNWKASEASIGGTPGTINSVNADNPDNTAPSLLSAFPSAADSLILYFDESLELTSVSSLNFSVDNGIGVSTSVEIFPANPSQVKLAFANNFSENIVYTVTCLGIKDCSGNEALINNTSEFGIAVPASYFDIVINEVLFNPTTDGSDYVEIYNRSNKFIDLSTLYLAEYDVNDTMIVTELTEISSQPIILLPEMYSVITADINSTAENYFISNTDNFIENNNTPNYPDDEGIVALQTANGDTIDRLHYFNDWHFALLDDENGVSLERLNYNYDTQDKNNWHSAAEDKHYGTPGYENSIFGDITSSVNNFNLDYDVFSPDGDGYHDYLIINYNQIAVGTVANVIIFDAQGRLINQLLNNVTISTEGFITWDGLNMDAVMAKMGIYIVYVDYFDLNGNTQHTKLKFTLIRK